MASAMLPFRSKDGLSGTDCREINRLVDILEGALKEEPPPKKKAKTSKGKGKAHDRKKEDFERKADDLLDTLRDWSKFRRPSSEAVRSTVDPSREARRAMRDLYGIIVCGLEDETILETPDYCQQLQDAHTELRDAMRGNKPTSVNQVRKVWKPSATEDEEGMLNRQCSFPII